jgi:hypothetical protein
MELRPFSLHHQNDQRRRIIFFAQNWHSTPFMTCLSKLLHELLSCPKIAPDHYMTLPARYANTTKGVKDSVLTDQILSMLFYKSIGRHAYVP